MDAKHRPLDQQVIVITGASSGIGLATATLAAERGATVLLLARSQQTLQAIREELTRTHAKVDIACVDVADRAALEAAAADCVRRHGRIDTWVNNAGASIYARLEEGTEADHRRLFDTNFWGVVNGSLVALPYLRRSGGALVNIGSELSETVIPLQGMYCASKHAVKGFTDALRVEVEELDDAPVTITLIQPTAVNTPYPQHARNYMDREPKLPEPQIDPFQVAAAILEAATEGGRDVKVGAMATVDVAVGQLLPRLGDRFAAMQADRQQQDRPPVDPVGNLYRATEDGRVHGHP